MASSPTARHHAALAQRDRRHLELIGVRAAARVGAQARMHAYSAYRTGHDPVAAVRDVVLGSHRIGTPGIIPLIRDGMVAAHLQGRRRTDLTAAPRFRAMGGYKLAGTAYDDALNWLRKRQELKAADLEAVAKKYDAEALRMARGVSQQLEQRLEKTMLDITSRGLHVRDGMAELRAAFKSAGWVPGADYQIEGMFRTQTQLAYAAGEWNADQDPAIQEILWGYEYVTVGDDRVRPTHAEMDGVTRPKDDPMWNIWTAPNGWCCRCSKLKIFDNGTSTETLPDVQPDPGFAFNPGTVFSDLIRTAA